MNRLVASLVALCLILGLSGIAQAELIGGPDIITAPAQAIDDNPGAENDHQQAFNERQNVVLPAAVSIDGGGSIAAGTLVDSHMIFLNTPVGTAQTSDFNVVWTFDFPIIGVMSDPGGNLEAASNSVLGAVGTIYPGAFAARGLENNSLDGYTISGNSISVDMRVTEPGDWIRVVTQVPAPGAALLAMMGLPIAGWVRRRFS